MLFPRVLGIAAGFFEQRPNLAGRGGQLGLVLGQRFAWLPRAGLGGRDVVRDLPLAFVQGRGNLRPGEHAEQ